MPAALTDITEIATALGTLSPTLPIALAAKPRRLLNVSEPAWTRLVAAYRAGEYMASFETAFANGAALLEAEDGLRGRPPKLVEWKGPHRPPGDDVIPADIRIDHVYQVSCKYLSKVMHNPGPARLFDRLLVGEERTSENWFATVAPTEYQLFYNDIRAYVGGVLPVLVSDLTATDRSLLKAELASRVLPDAVQHSWASFCRAVSEASARRWRANLNNPRKRLRLLWRLLRIAGASYFVLGTDRASHLRLRVASAWDWVQSYELRWMDVAPKAAGQPEVSWRAIVRERDSGVEVDVHGHVEVRWSHGRFQGAPEAKVYLDIPHVEVPGYFPLE